jgi:hypothetical protein
MEEKEVGDNSIYGESELHTAQSFMYKDTPLTPKMISSLMHVESTLQNSYTSESKGKNDTTYGALYVVSIVVASLAIAGVVGTSFLYFHEIGPFSSEVEARVWLGDV